jgi:lipopolysaccharide export system permease protein
MPGILNRYIFRETAQTWLVVTLVLLVILVTSQFAQVLGDAAADRVPVDAVFQVMGLTSVQYLTILIPIALFLSIMIALGRLYRDSEMDAMMACGIGPVGLYRPLFILAVLLSVVVGWLSLFVAPEALREVQSIASEARKQANLNILEAAPIFGSSSSRNTVYLMHSPGRVR